MRILRFINKAVENLERALIITSLSLMVLLTFLNIMLRTLYTHGHILWANTLLGQVDWTEPFVRLLVLWITFLGASLITGQNRHIRIDMMRSLLPPGWLPVREIILSVCCMIICALMLKASIEYILIEMDYGSNLFFGVPSWVYQLILPAGFSVMIFRFFLGALEQSMGLAGKDLS